MSEIHKIEKNGVTIYPATTYQAVVNPATKQTLFDMYNYINGGAADISNRIMNPYPNYVLEEGVTGFEQDTFRRKIGDGKTPYKDLPYEPLILIRGDNKDKWLEKNYVIAKNEIVIDLDDKIFKVGDGTTDYLNLIPFTINPNKIDSYFTDLGDSLFYRKNYLQLNNITLGIYINDSNGKFFKSDTPDKVAVTGFNPIKPNTTYGMKTFSSGVYSVHFYDRDKKWISSERSSFINGLTQHKTSDNTAYVVVCWISNENLKIENLKTSVVLYEYGSYIPEKYEHFNSILVKESLIEPILNSKNYAFFTTITGKNLFNKDTVIKGQAVSYGGGNIGFPSDRFNTGATSDYIPVEPGKIYFLHRTFSASDTVFTFYNKTKDKASIPLDPITDSPLSEKEYVNKSRAYKAGTDAAFAMFTIRLSNYKDSDADGIQFEEGDSFTGYEPYDKRDIIDYPNLPKELGDLPEKVELIENSIGNTLESINIRNSDKIGFFSNSFLNGYCMLGKHAINNLSMFSDYIMYNYGHSGDDLLELLGRINSNETWLGDVPVQEWGIKYGVIAMQDNDGALFAASSDTYYENGKKLANAIKAMGGIPLLSTEHDQVRYYYNFVRLSNEEGYLFMNWGKTASALFNNVFAPFWNNSHPATRTAWMWTYGIKQYLDTLPRPYKSIKLFRVRNTIDTSNLQNLMYEDFYSRAERFEELTCGVSGLTESTEKYFDRLDTGNASYQTYKDEYQMLQAKTSPVSFGNFALIEIVTPYDKNNITSLSFQLDGTGITNAYIKRINSLDNPLPSTRYIAFGVTDGEALLTPGTKFQIIGGVFNNNLLGTYIVEDVINGIVVTTTSSSGKTTSGTDAPTVDIEGVQLLGSYDYPSADYMNRYNKPLGEWEEISLQDNKVILDSYLHGCMDFDKISILLRGTNIILNDLNCTVSGQYKKQSFHHPILLEKKGESIINTTTFNDEDMDWEGIENLEKYIPVVSTVNPEKKENLPKGITTVRIINPGQSIKQPLNTGKITSSNFLSAQLEIKLIARYFPEYIDDDSKWNTSPIKRGSFDCATLDVMIAANSSDENPVIVGRIVIGAWWNQFIIDMPYFEGTHLILKCSNKQIQVAKCDCVLLN